MYQSHWEKLYNAATIGSHIMNHLIQIGTSNHVTRIVFIIVMYSNLSLKQLFSEYENKENRIREQSLHTPCKQTGGSHSLFSYVK